MVTDALLDRFGTDSLRDWLALPAGAGLPEGYYSVVESGSREHSALAGAQRL